MKNEDKRVSYRVSAEDYKRLEAAAKAKGLSVTAFARMTAFDAANAALRLGMS